MQNMIVMLMCGLYALFNVSGAALIKSTLPHYRLDSVKGYVQFLLTWQVICGFAIILVSALVMFKALSLGKFSYVIPVATGINFSFTILLGVWVFHDQLTWLSWIGLALILGGILLMSLKIG